VGKPPTLLEADEEALAAWIKYQILINLPAIYDDIRIAAAKLAHARGASFHSKDDSGLPSRHWWNGFQRRRGPFVQRRHHRLTPGLPSREALRRWSAVLRDFIIEHDITADRLWNVDETGVDGRYGRQTKVVTVPGDDPCVVGPTWRGHFTAVICVNAAGEHVPPMWIAQGGGPITDQQTRLLTADCIPGTGVVNTRSGWIDNPTWSVWLQFFISNLAERKPTKERPLLLILDSHESRFAWQSIQYAMDNHIIIYALLPNSTSICQPLDVSFFGPFKVRELLYVDSIRSLMLLYGVCVLML
jgi:hypothetical protein